MEQVSFSENFTPQGKQEMLSSCPQPSIVRVHFFKLIFNKQNPTYTSFLQVVTFLQFFPQEHVCISLLHQVCHMLRPSHPPSFDHLNNTS